MDQPAQTPHHTTADTPRLQARDLSFGFPGHLLFSGLSADIGPGVTLVRGGDGRGKTSLLRVLAGEAAPQGGSVERLGSAAAAPVFFVDPRAEAFDQLTPLAWWAAERRRWPGFDGALLDELAQSLSLAPHQAKEMFRLSTGSRRKVFMAAAFASGAPLTFIDQPFAALDKPSIDAITALLQAASRQVGQGGRAVVIADYEAPPGVSLAEVIDLGD